MSRFKQPWLRGWEQDDQTSAAFPPSRKFCGCGREFIDAWEESRHRLGKHNYHSWTKADSLRQSAKMARGKR